MSPRKPIVFEYGISGGKATLVVENRLDGPYVTPKLVTPVKADVLATALFELGELYGMFDRSPVAYLSEPYMFGGDGEHRFLGLADRTGLSAGEETQVTIAVSMRVVGGSVVNITPGSLWALHLLMRGSQLPTAPLVLRKVVRPEDN